MFHRADGRRRALPNDRYCQGESCRFRQLPPNDILMQLTILFIFLHSTSIREVCSQSLLLSVLCWVYFFRFQNFASLPSNEQIKSFWSSLVGGFVEASNLFGKPKMMRMPANYRNLIAATSKWCCWSLSSRKSGSKSPWSFCKSANCMRLTSKCSYGK